MSDKNLNEWLFADIDDLIDCDYSDESEAENRMTDNEIIKALESEIRSAEYVDSEYCDGVDLTLIKSAIDLINRQHEKIEKLKGISVSPSKDSMDFCGVLCDYAEELIDKAKSEAYKEFAERLKEGAQMADCFDSYNMVVGTHFINNLLKEMIDE